MGRSREVAELVVLGKTPTEVAAQLGLSIASVEGYLHRAVGEGILRRSDIYFAVPAGRRRSDPTIGRWYANPRLALGDMYEDIRRIEIALHDRIHEALVRAYGDNESGWWRQGVPERVRVKCQERREMDQDDPCEPFCYSDLLDLSTILEDRWPVLGHLLGDYASNRKQLSRDLRLLNRIRNKVMHPVRGLVPGEEDFDFVRGLQRSLRCL